MQLFVKKKNKMIKPIVDNSELNDKIRNEIEDIVEDIFVRYNDGKTDATALATVLIGSLLDSAMCNAAVIGITREDFIFCVEKYADAVYGYKTQKSKDVQLTTSTIEKQDNKKILN